MAATVTAGPNGNVGVDCLECPEGLLCVETGLAWGGPLRLRSGAWQKFEWVTERKLTAAQFLDLDRPAQCDELRCTAGVACGRHTAFTSSESG